jgi:4-amino-4-deoxy-L-arabinose transferase-like glycosyltransferase
MKRNSALSPELVDAPAVTVTADAHRTGDRSVAFWAGVGFIALTGLFLIAVAAFFHPIGDYYAESDFYGGYADGARMIARGDIDPRRYVVVGPLYETMVALLSGVAGDRYAAGKLVSVASAIAVLIGWFVLVRRHAGDRAAAWTTAFLGTNAILLRHGYSATTDMLAAALQVSSLLLLLGVSSSIGFAAAGLLAGLAMLTRYSSIFLVPAAALTLLVLARPTRVAPGRALGLWLAGFALIVAPWAIFSVAHGVVPGSVLAERFGFYWQADASRNVQDLVSAPPTDPYDSAAGVVRRDPGAFVARLAGNVGRHLAGDARVLLGWPLAILVAIGAVLAIAAARRTPMTRGRAIAAHGALLFAILLPAFYSERYALPLVPFYAALAGFAVTRIGRTSRAASIAATTVAVLVLAVTTSRALSAVDQALRESPLEVIPAGRALARVATKETRVMSRKGHIGYYAGLEVVPFPRAGSLRELADRARAEGAGFLYYSWYETRLRREFGFLLDTTADIPGLTRVFFTRHEPATVFAIGPDFGRDPSWFADPFAVEVHNARGLVESFPDSLAWPYRTVLAVDALGREHPEEALRLAELATRAMPRDTLGWVVMGEALRTLGRNDRALDAYRHALALDPGDPQAAVGAGWVLLALGRRREAASAWRPVVGVAADTTTLGAMTRLFESLGDDEAAAAARARRSGPPRTRAP